MSGSNLPKKSRGGAKTRMHVPAMVPVVNEDGGDEEGELQSGQPVVVYSGALQEKGTLGGAVDGNVDGVDGEQQQQQQQHGEVELQVNNRSSNRVNRNHNIPSSSDEEDVVLRSLMKKSRKRAFEERKQIYSPPVRQNQAYDSDEEDSPRSLNIEIPRKWTKSPRGGGNNVNGNVNASSPPPPKPRKPTQKVFNTPDETYEAMIAAAVKKGNSSILYTLIGGFMAGMFIGFGGLAAVVVGLGSESLDPGMKKFWFAAVFPFGLMMVYIGEPELFTGNNMLMAVGKLSKKVTWRQVAKNWIFSWIGNLIGSLFVAGLLCHAGGILDKEPWREGVQKLAWHKVHEMDFSQTFVRAIGCNILVCMAIYHQFASMDIISKVWGIWWPIMAFVAIGFEHSVANMFFIPAGMFAGADVTVLEFLGRNLLLVTVGNMIGAVCFVSVPFHFFYASHQRYAPSTSAPQTWWQSAMQHPFFTPRVDAEPTPRTMKSGASI